MMPVYAYSVAAIRFGIDNYIARGSKINFRADIKQIDGNDIARRGRKPGINVSSRLNRIF